MNTLKPINLLIDEFLSEVDCKPNTIANYRLTLGLWVEWMTINANIKDPSKANLLGYREYLKKEHKVSTIDSYMASLRLFFAYLSAKNIHPNISLGIKRLKKSDDHTRGYLNEAQVKELLTIMPKDTLINKRNYAIVNLMVRTGIRCVEVITLNYVDYIKGIAGFDIKIQRKGRNEKDATIHMTQSIANPINDYLRDRDMIMANDPLFARCGQCAGQRITTKTISHIVMDSFKMIGVVNPDMTAHSLRHTAAMCAVRAGASPYEVQQMLGHKNPSTTMIYIRALERENREAASAINYLDKAFQIEDKP